MQQRFIEHDLPLAEISEESAREKNTHIGLPPQFHVWFARRPTTVSRAIVLAALLDDPGPHEPDKRRELRQAVAEVTRREAAKNGNGQSIHRARKLIRDQYTDAEGHFSPPRVIDPFSGGGSIPLEALRLGCSTLASDYNPVAVLLEKATLKWPQQFGVEVELPEDDDNGLGMGGKKVNLLAYLVEKWANKILEAAREEIGQFYPTETGKGLVGKRDVDPNQEGWIPVGYIWARTIPCQNPTCEATIPLIKRFWLARDSKKEKYIAFRGIIDPDTRKVEFEIRHGKSVAEVEKAHFDPSDGTVNQANASCLACGQVTKAETVRQLARDGKMGEQMVAVALHHPDEKGKKYRVATERDREIYRAARDYLEEKIDNWSERESPAPTEKIPTYELRRVALPLYGYETWGSIFNDRQTLALITLTQKLRDARASIEKDCKRMVQDSGTDVEASQLARVIRGYLGILIDRQVDFGSSLCTWESGSEILKHSITGSEISMTWDYAEVNPFSGSTGSFEVQHYYLDKSLRYFCANAGNVPDVRKMSALDLDVPDNSFQAVVTDPPYYDNVPYAVLSDFFYVWLKRSLGEDHPELFSTPLTAKSEEIVHDRPHSRSDSQKSKEFFETKLGESFAECFRVLEREGIAVIVYAHKTTEGWETMLKALVSAGFVVTASWPAQSEMEVRLRAAQTAALASSIYMVCRKTEREALGFWNDIQPQIKSRVEEKLQQFWDADVIRGGDFFISAIGPCMEAYSRYDEVQTYSGETITVADLLQYIRKVATDFLVQRLLRGVSGGTIDKEAQFYLTYRWTFRDTRVEYDDALRIAKAEGVNLDRLADGDTFIKKTRKYVYVHGPQKRDAIDAVYNMVDAMHQACRMWEGGRKDDVGTMLAQYGYNQNPSFWQLCQAVAECLPNGNKEKQWLEGMLMSKDAYQDVETLGESGTRGGQTEMDFDT